ncbi:hypothetical protein [Microcystis aeruginosa]|uniref:hypothetical protein n=1 Tax=Microcystis aeruginosa TaxID=1126 RepID=UPI001230B489|nr:hypothetical protein [Microcystis aeruginosa]
MNWGVGKWGSCLITLSPQNPITPKPYHPKTLSPQNPITPKPYHPKTLSPISCLLNPESRLWIFAGGLSKEPRLFGKLKR